MTTKQRCKYCNKSIEFEARIQRWVLAKNRTFHCGQDPRYPLRVHRPPGIPAGTSPGGMIPGASPGAGTQ
jgi:hypothetical protein